MYTLLALSIVCCMLCSGCISGDNAETAAPTTTVAPTTTPPTTTIAPTTVPPNVNTTPILASELQTEWANLNAEYELWEEEIQTMLDTLQNMAQAPDQDYSELNLAFENYKAAMTEYLSVQNEYYHVSILLEHTEPIEGDLLALKKETLPFTRPNGDTYTYGALNMAGESYMALTDRIGSYIEDGVDGGDVRQELVEALGDLEEFLPGYYDMWIGYVYYYCICLARHF